jgi:hypothetical protein
LPGKQDEKEVDFVAIRREEKIQLLYEKQKEKLSAETNSGQL